MLTNPESSSFFGLNIDMVGTDDCLSHCWLVGMVGCLLSAVLVGEAAGHGSTLWGLVGMGLGENVWQR